MTQEQEKTVQLLRSARQAQLLLQSLECSLESDKKLLKLLELLKKSGADLSSGVHQNSGISPDDPTFQERRQRELLTLLRIRQEISDGIAQVPDPELRAILERRYLACQTMNQIAEAMHFDLRTIQRKHKKALEFLKNSGIFQNLHIRNANFSESVL